MRTCRVGNLAIGDDAPVRLMGVVNCSPESFFSGSFVPPKDVFTRAVKLIEQGADMIDIGARSTAPAAIPISVAEEKDRITRALKEFSGSGILISIDTMYPEVLDACLHYEIHAINDIHGLANPEFGAVAGDSGLPAFLMASFSSPGDPAGLEQTMAALGLVLERAKRFDIEEVILDPGIGKWTEARTFAHDWELCRNFGQFGVFGRPLLAAVSRKSFIGDLLGNGADDRLAGSLGVTFRLLQEGASAVRTHDVKETRDIIRVHEQLG